MKLRIHQITWNIGSTYPIKHELYESLFCLNKNLDYKFGDYPDFIVISLQEQRYDILENYWESKFKKLFRKLKQRKGFKYVKLQTNSIFFQNQYIFVDYKLLRKCKDLETLKFTNYGGISGKGTIAFKFRMDSEKFAFLSGHLDAHETGNKDRLNHYKRVITEDLFYDFSRILQCSFSFYAGDLNFRLIFPDKIQLINDLIEKGSNEKFLESLFSNDQLKIAQENSDAFQHFTETKIKFKPTFKYHPNSMDYNPKRTPSWCDRILYLKKTKCEQIYYNSVEEYKQSDHRPVVSAFDLESNIQSEEKPKVKIISASRTDVDDKYDVWINKKIRDTDSLKSNLFLGKQDYTDSEESRRNSKAGWDWIGLFEEDFDDLDDYLAYLYVEDMPCNSGPPEEILMKMNNMEKTEKSKEDESIAEYDDQPASSSREPNLKSTEDTFKDDPYFKELKKRLEWNKLEFSEQTFTQPGRYVLIYFNGDKSVESISEPFEVVAN